MREGKRMTSGKDFWVTEDRLQSRRGEERQCCTASTVTRPSSKLFFLHLSSSEKYSACFESQSKRRTMHICKAGCSVQQQDRTALLTTYRMPHSRFTATALLCRITYMNAILHFRLQGARAYHQLAASAVIIHRIWV